MFEGVTVQKVSILVAQNGSLFCEGIAGLIEKEGGFAVTVRSGVAQLRSELVRRPDVVLLCSSFFTPDGMPAVLQDIKKTAPQARILIVLEEDILDEALMHFLMLGADGYLRKSATSCQLVEAIRAIHAGGIWAERPLLNKFIKSPILGFDVETKLLQIKVPLTPREKEIISLLFLGLSNKAIADRIYISEKTVKTHFNSIFRKLEVKSRAQALAFLSR